MLEVKADALEASFDAFEDDGVAALKEELEQLKSKISAGVIAAQRPALDGVKSASSVSFVDGYLRRGIESMPPDDYEQASYYERWLFAAETILVEKGVLTLGELDARLG